MRRTLLVCLFAALVPCAPLAAQDDVVGLWWTAPSVTGYAQVEITRDGDMLRGTIVGLSEPDFPDSEGPEWAGKPKVDRNNPDAAKRGQAIIGLEILWGFKAKGGGRWQGGRVYDPENGKTYKAKLTLRGDGDLDLRGFIGVSLIGRTSTWTRAEPTP